MGAALLQKPGELNRSASRRVAAGFPNEEQPNVAPPNVALPNVGYFGPKQQGWRCSSTKIGIGRI